MRVNIAFAGVLSLAAGNLCSAQKIDPVAPHKGAYSVSFAAQWIQQRGFGTITTFRMAPSYFISDAIEVRVPLAFIKGAGSDEIVYGVGARWHPMAHSGTRNSLVDPFVGLEYEHAVASHFREDFSAAQAGVNYFVANNIAISGIVQYGSDRGPGLTQSTFNISIGFAIFFSGK